MDEIPDWVKQEIVRAVVGGLAVLYWRKYLSGMSKVAIEEFAKFYVLCQLFVLELLHSLAKKAEEDSLTDPIEEVPVFIGNAPELAQVADVHVELSATMQRFAHLLQSHFKRELSSMKLPLPYLKFEPMKVSFSPPKFVFQPMRFKVSPMRFNVLSNTPFTPPKFTVEPARFYVKPHKINITPARLYLGV